MKRMMVACVAGLVLAGCVEGPRGSESVGETRLGGVSTKITRPRTRPAGLGTAARPPQGARTAEAFDTTSAEDRAAAQSAPAGPERPLGTTIASLGAPSEPGFWLKTPLVDRQTPGRVAYPATGKSAQVTLLPLDGPRTAGSHISLAALRLIGAPLTGLPEVSVFAVE